MKVIIYISNWNLIGGVEVFTKNFCKRMSKHHEITLLYHNCSSEEQVKEMQQYCEVIKLDKKQRYSCGIFISSSAWGQEGFSFVDAKINIQMVHADYRHVIQGWAFNYKKHPNTTHHVCVGELVKESFEIATTYKSDAVIHNLLDNNFKLNKKPKNKKLTLITCSRISGEKGFGRMLKMAQQLDNLGIDYVWNIYGDDSSAYAKQTLKTFSQCKNVFFKGITTEAFKEINKADYLVQLSDTEGFAYSVYEAMQVKTPCIITPFASGNEQIKDGVNGFIVPFEMEDINYEKILKRNLKVPEFEELGKEEHWNIFFEKCMEWFDENMVSVRITSHVQIYKIGQIVNISKDRAKSGIERGLCELIEKPID